MQETTNTSRDQDRDARLSEAPQAFNLLEQIARIRGDKPYRENGKTSIILSRKEHLRVVLTALQSGKEMEPHHTDGPFTLQVFAGSLRLTWGKEQVTLQPNDFLTFPGEVEHAVLALEDCAFLLTLYQRTEPTVNLSQ